jgi:hypothetical protein
MTHLRTRGDRHPGCAAFLKESYAAMTPNDAITFTDLCALVTLCAVTLSVGLMARSRVE